MKANLEIDVGQKTFSDGLLPELIAALRRSRPGDLMAVVTSKSNLSADFEIWCRLTRNSLIELTVEAGRSRYVIRCGEVMPEPEAAQLSAHASGCTRTSIATFGAATAACDPRQGLSAGRSASRACGGSQAKRRSSACRRFS